MAKRRVAVIGSSQTHFRRAWSDRQHVDLIGEAVRQALLGTGIRIQDVDFIIDSGSDFLDGRSISNCGFLGAMGAHHREESRVEEDGLWAALYAATKIASGSARVGLVIAYSKSSESNPRNYWSNLAEPFTQRPVGLDQYSAAGLMAQAYLATSSASLSHLDSVVRRSWELAAANPKVDVSVDDLSDPRWNEVVASPLRRAHMAQPIDGAVAMVLVDEDTARQTGAAPAWITGMGTTIDQHFLAARDLTALEGARHAAAQAFRMAGLSGAADCDLIEVSANSVVGELMVLEALGLADRGAAVSLYDSGHADRINASGGSLAADVVMATGLARLHEVTAQLSGRSSRPVGNARRGLAHGSGGLGMQNNCVITVETS